MKYFFYAFLITLIGLSLGELHAATDVRVCGEPARDANGVIIRSSKVTSDFQKLHACPSTGLNKGACPGWAKDHVIPLDCGGCDSVANLQWLKNSIKSCAGLECKDRWERKINCTPMQIVK